MKLEIDIKEFQKALDKYAEATRKDVPTVLNHAAGQSALHAFNYTKAAKDTAKGLSPKYDPTLERVWTKYKKGRKDPARLYYALAQKTGAQKGDIKRRAIEIWKKRRQSMGYIRVQWRSLASKFGVKGTFQAVDTPDMRYQKATFSYLIAEVYNARLEGSGQGKAQSKLNNPWMRAINKAVFGPKGMVWYAEKLIKKRWKR